jgi:hypothetical protein
MHSNRIKVTSLKSEVTLPCTLEKGTTLHSMTFTHKHRNCSACRFWLGTDLQFDGCSECVTSPSTLWEGGGLQGEPSRESSPDGASYQVLFPPVNGGGVVTSLKEQRLWPGPLRGDICLFDPSQNHQSIFDASNQPINRYNSPCHRERSHQFHRSEQPRRGCHIGSSPPHSDASSTRIRRSSVEWAALSLLGRRKIPSTGEIAGLCSSFFQHHLTFHQGGQAPSRL